jgi:multiple sugar transport system substrate-binding protein
MPAEAARVQLRGITWDHTRGYLPLVATAQRFAETYDGIEIIWEKRSLRAFGDEPIEALAASFDLLVLDHPLVGDIAQSSSLLPLDLTMPASVLEEQRSSSVGASFDSYRYGDGDHLWAIPIDAAAPVSAWRPDLIDVAPTTWDDVLELAREGRVCVPGTPVDSVMNIYMVLMALGELPGRTAAELAPSGAIEIALHTLQGLLSMCDPNCLDRNPVRTYEVLATDERLAYCPFAFGYSNYARTGFAKHRLRFGPLVAFERGWLVSPLGGAGLSVSSSSRYRDVALAYVQFVASRESQTGIYVAAGGQPAHRSAWLDPATNAMAWGYFADTLPTVERAFLRPRHRGYPRFQVAAGDAISSFLRHGGHAGEVASQINELFRASVDAGRQGD